MKKLESFSFLHTKKCVAKSISKHGEAWNEHDDNELLFYYKRGYHVKGIATILGRSVASIESRISFVRKRKVAVVC